MQDLESITVNGRLFVDRRLRHHHNNQTTLKCPRCESSNTKFCYYNNYNLSQPRHFCKNCRRYWTNGGVLRNVPVGGGCRKSSNKHQQQRSPSSSNKPKLPKKHSNTTTLSNNSNATIIGPSQLGNFDNSHDNSEVLLFNGVDDTVSFSEFIENDLTVYNNNNNPTRTVEDEGHVHGLFDFGGTSTSTIVGDEHHGFWSQPMSTFVQDLSHWSTNNTTSDFPLFLP